MLRIFLKGFTEFPNATFQHIVGHESIWPDPMDELVPCHQFTLSLNEANEHFHGLGLHVYNKAVALDFVLAWSDEPVAYLKGVTGVRPLGWRGK